MSRGSTPRIAEACVVAHSVGGAVVVRLLAEAEPPQPLAGALR